MIFQSTPTTLFTPFLIGYILATLIGVGLFFAARHPNERGIVAQLLTWLRRIVAAGFIAIGLIGILNIVMIFSQEPIVINRYIQAKEAYRCARSTECYVVRTHQEITIEVRQEAYRTVQVNSCYEIRYYPIHLPLHRYQNIAYSIVEKDEIACA